MNPRTFLHPHPRAMIYLHRERLGAWRWEVHTRHTATFPDGSRYAIVGRPVAFGHAPLLFMAKLAAACHADRIPA